MSLRPSVCIDAVLANMPIAQALKTIHDCGYRAFEFWEWWSKDLDALLRERDSLGLEVAACCTKFVSLVDPTAREAYLDGLEESIAAAKRLDCPVLISQVGDYRPGVPREDQRACLIEGLRQAAELLTGTGVTLAIEPLNDLIDHPGYYLVRSDEAFQVVESVGSPQVKVTFDIYHQQISEGQLIANILANIDHIAHFHAAGNPGRHELTNGEIHYPSIFSAIAKTSFDGYVGLEYWPLAAAEHGLAEVAQWFIGDPPQPAPARS
jgi:hydroxypyruvate isomerase